MNGPATRRLLRFSVFEIDLDSGELFKKGQKLKLQGQPFELLIELLNNTGSVVTREQLKERLWPGDTAGDFDSSLNRAINRIREVLGDSAESPHFIETLPRRGYRFIGAVAGGNVVEATPVAAASEVDKEVGRPTRRERDWKVAALAGVAFAVALLVTWWIAHRIPEPPRDPTLRQLTTNSSENPVSHAIISPDGKYLAYGDSAGIRLQEIATGQTHAIAKPKTLSEDDAWFPSAWFPDGARMVASAIRTNPDGRVSSSSWSVPILGNPILLRDDAFAPSVSPDGSLIAFTANRFGSGPLGTFSTPWSREIWVMGPNGEDARKLVSSDGKTLFRCVQWSPANGRISYVELREDRNPHALDIQTITLKGDPPDVLLPDFPGYEFRWIPDGRILYTRQEAAPNNRDANLWAVEVHPKTGKPRSAPRQITKLPGFGMTDISVSSDGKKVTVQKVSWRSDTYIGRLKAGGQLEAPRRLTSDERDNLPFAWTIDSKSVIFVSDRTGVNAIYKQEIDQTLAEQIPTGPERVWLPRATPDGSSILYFASPNLEYPWLSARTNLMRVPVSGGARKLLTQFPGSGSGWNLDCPIQPNAQCVIEVCAGGPTATFIALDPLTEKRRELFRQDGLYQWTLSPDGAHIGELRGENVVILSLAGQVEQTIHIKGWPYLESIDRTADGKALLLSHIGPTKATLLRVGLDGQIQPLWGMANPLGTWAIASPDGRYLAISGRSIDSNAWLLENF